MKGQLVMIYQLCLFVPADIEKMNLYKAIVEFARALDIMPKIRNKLENGSLENPLH